MKTSINLMTAKARRNEQLRQIARQWFAPAIGIAVLIGVTDWWHRVERDKVVWQRLAVEAEIEPMRELQTEINVLRRRLDSVKENERVALSLAREFPPLTLLGQLSEAVVGGNGDVFLTKLELRTDPTPTNEPTGRRGTIPLTISIDGMGVDNVAVAHFVASLRDTRLFGTVELKHSRSKVGDEGRSSEFQVECGLN